MVLAPLSRFVSKSVVGLSLGYFFFFPVVARANAQLGKLDNVVETLVLTCDRLDVVACPKLGRL